MGITKPLTAGTGDLFGAVIGSAVHHRAQAVTFKGRKQ